MYTYNKSFAIGHGKRAYAQAQMARAIGRKRIVEVLFQYRPADIFYHYWKCGGHVGALKLHASSRSITRLDIEGFFGCVNRTRLSRALRHIGFGWRTAYEIAFEAVVVEGRKKILPIGFVQS